MSFASSRKSFVCTRAASSSTESRTHQTSAHEKCPLSDHSVKWAQADTLSACLLPSSSHRAHCGRLDSDALARPAPLADLADEPANRPRVESAGIHPDPYLAAADWANFILLFPPAVPARASMTMQGLLNTAAKRAALCGRLTKICSQSFVAAFQAGCGSCRLFAQPGAKTNASANCLRSVASCSFNFRLKSRS